jgi:hypothetical protein
MMAFNWTCPHCTRAQTVVDAKYDKSPYHISIAGLDEGSVSIVTHAVGCSNIECLKLTLEVWVQRDLGARHDYKLASTIVDGSYCQVLPRAGGKTQPEYIPAPLREDYLEACLIRDASPKAAATLVRRCLQGMIRDFAAISKRTLDDEIKALRAAVDNSSAPDGVTHDSVDAIDAVRSIGNIGAHMERDINLIVDVEPGEAQMLIELVELLFDEWYVARHKRQARLVAIQQLAADKKQELADLKAGSTPNLAAPALAITDEREAGA